MRNRRKHFADKARGMDEAQNALIPVLVDVRNLEQAFGQRGACIEIIPRRKHRLPALKRAMRPQPRQLRPLTFRKRRTGSALANRAGFALELHGTNTVSLASASVSG